jgi:hypothetical protein
MLSWSCAWSPASTLSPSCALTQAHVASMHCPSRLCSTQCHLRLVQCRMVAHDSTVRPRIWQGESFPGSDIVGSALAAECAGESSSYLASDLLIYDFCSSFEFASLFSSIYAGFYPRASSIYTRLVGGITTCIIIFIMCNPMLG